MKNAVVYDVTTAFRYEDNIQNLRIWNSTVGRNVTRAFQAASAPSATLDVRNLLSIPALTRRGARGVEPAGRPRPSFVERRARTTTTWRRARRRIDAGERLDEVTIDRDGVAAPAGRRLRRRGVLRACAP